MAPRRKSIFIMQVTETNVVDVFLWAKVKTAKEQLDILKEKVDGWWVTFQDDRLAYVKVTDWLIMHGEHKIEIISDEGKQYMAKRQPDLFMTVSAAVPEYKHG